MDKKSYRAQFLQTDTPQGPVSSLSFVVNRNTPRYVDLPSIGPRNKSRRPAERRERTPPIWKTLSPI